jgi:hypothetical protein
MLHEGTLDVLKAHRPVVEVINARVELTGALAGRA